jgi:hypothetical protein
MPSPQPSHHQATMKLMAAAAPPHHLNSLKPITTTIASMASITNPFTIAHLQANSNPQPNHHSCNPQQLPSSLSLTAPSICNSNPINNKYSHKNHREHHHSQPQHRGLLQSITAP